MRQGTFDELGTPLRDLEFVVVDLETTGGSPADCGITEIGAVRVRGGHVLGEFHTLVDPGEPIPPFIQVLTGISDALVAGAPRVSAVLPGFLAFAEGAVLVAHNAPFDVGFLRTACQRTGRPWPPVRVLDTARLARRVVTRDEARDCRLSTLAVLFRSATTPTHRALDDARATVDVLHGMLERLGNLGVQTWEELVTFSGQVSPAQRRKRHLADGLPAGPGVYVFRDGQGRPLYVGTSRDVRARVRQYFVASEERSRMAEMVGLAERVDALACAHPLEAQVRELRLLAEHKPRYNRRSRFPERARWLALTADAFPRLAVVGHPRDADCLGPFGSRAAAETVRDVLQDAIPLRRCTLRMGRRTRASACALADLGRCGAPCEGRQDQDEYAQVVQLARRALSDDPHEVVEQVRRRVARLVGQERFEEAASARDRLAAYLRALTRMQRLAGFTRVAELVAARPRPAGGWDLVVVRHGRLAAAGTVPGGASPRPYVDALLVTAEAVGDWCGPCGAASAAEVECVLRWLDEPGARLARATAGWSEPTLGAARYAQWLAAAEADQMAVHALDDRRGLRPVHRPARAG